MQNKRFCLWIPSQSANLRAMIRNLGRTTLQAWHKFIPPFGGFALACVALPFTAYAALTQLSDDTDAVAQHLASQLASAQPSIAVALPVVQVERTVKVGKGEHVVETLQRIGFTNEQANAMLAGLNGQVALNGLKAGTELTVSYAEDMPYHVDNAKVSFRSGPVDEIHLGWNDGKASAKVVKHKLEDVQAVAVGHIQNSLYEDATEAGLPANLIKPFVDLFAWDIDYTRDIHPGDTFKIVFEETKNDLGQRVKTGRILGASFTVGGETKQAFWFVDEAGRGDYYNEKGEGKRKLLLRTPLETYRISSGFNLNRKHPVLGFTRAHKGTDFAAPMGTPVMSSGDGVVTFVGRHGGHGNFVKVQHNGTFTTAYAHLQRYAKNIRVGARVKQGQTIAYVGSTGISTGPHLHYEVIKNGSHVNAMSTALPTGTMMAGKAKSRFLAMVDGMKGKWAKALTQLAMN